MRVGDMAVKEANRRVVEMVGSRMEGEMVEKKEEEEEWRSW